MLFCVSDGHIFFDVSNYCPTAVSDIDQTNINRDIRDGNWLSNLGCANHQADANSAQWLFITMMIIIYAPIANFENVRSTFIKYEITNDIFRPGLGIDVDEQAVRRFHVPIKN